MRSEYFNAFFAECAADFPRQPSAIGSKRAHVDPLVAPVLDVNVSPLTVRPSGCRGKAAKKMTFDPSHTSPKGKSRSKREIRVA